MVDIGINLNHRSFSSNLDQILSDSFSSGVTTLILTGTSWKSSRSSAQLVDRLSIPSSSESSSSSSSSSSSTISSSSIPELWYTSGIHPHDAASWKLQKDPDATLTQLCAAPRCVAVGECGLDFNRMFSPQAEQEQCFVAHIKVAVALNKPLFLHERDAFDRFIHLLREHRPSKTGPPAVVHCFTGTSAQVQAYLAEGCYIGITGWVTDPRRGRALRELIPLIPLDRLMIETDAPFLTPFNLPFSRPRTNEPQFLPYVAEELAKIYGITPAKLCQQTTANAKLFFNLK